MIFDYVIYILVSLLASLASYYLTSNVYVLIGTIAIYLAYFITYEIVFKRKQRIKFKRDDDLNIFIHDFFLSYSVNFSLEQGIENGVINVSSALKEQTKMLDEFKSEDKLDHLSDYFSSSLYQLFLKTINLCENYSEDRTKTIVFLLEENNRYIFNKKILQRNIWRSFTEFSLLWVVSFLILIILRLAVNNYFDRIAHTWFYLVGIALYFLFFLFSIHLFMHTTYRRIKRYEQ